MDETPCFEPRDRCPECGIGELDHGPVEDCSCHIWAPCGSCVKNPLRCPTCAWVEEVE